MMLEAISSRERNYNTDLLFYEVNNPAFITSLETFARVTYNLGPTHNIIFGVSASYGRSIDKYYAENSIDFAKERKDNSRYDIAVLDFHFKKNTLNRTLYPTEGQKIEAVLKGFHEDVHYNPGMRESEEEEGGVPAAFARKSIWSRFRASLKAEWMQFFPFHKRFVLGAKAEGLLTLSDIRGNFTAEEIHAAPFAPTPATANIYNPAFRSDNYLAIGLIPAWIPVSGFQIRGDFYAYNKVRKISMDASGRAVADGWFPKTNFITQVSAIYSLPFAAISVYGNYISYPKKNWNFGINLGLFFQAPRLLH